MNDNYTHTDNKLVYITENIPGPKENSVEYEKLLDNYNSQYTGCVCKEHCLYPACKCVQQSHGTNYESTSHALDFFMLSIKTDDRTYPIFECTDHCPCSPSCGNRVVQKGPIQGLTVRCCTQKGFGLFTTHTIPKRTFICEYAGEILTKSQALERTKVNKEKNYDNYIFCLNEHSSMTKQTFVDPSQFGNIGRYINHSCDPNSCIVPVRTDSLIPKLAIFACKDIDANEEITFSYGKYDNLKDIYKTGKKCYCNTDKCQGYLPFNDFE